MAGAEIVPPNSLCDRNKKSSMVLFLCVSHVCSHKRSQAKKEVMPQHVSPSIPRKLAMAVLPPAAVEAVVEVTLEAAVEAAVAEAATGGEVMVVEIMAETAAAVGAFNNQP